MAERLAQQLIAARAAQAALQSRSTEQIRELLESIAAAIEEHGEEILTANATDLASIGPAEPTYDRIRLTTERIRGIADGLRVVATLPDPVGRILEERARPNGLQLQKVSVPFGTVAAIYEARPNVTVDIAGLGLKSRNSVILKGGSEADQTSRALVTIIHDVLTAHDLPAALVVLLPPDRAVALELVQARGLIDLLVARGSQQLIDWTREHARVPFIETGAGVCHVYVDTAADVTLTTAIVTNAKTRRPSVCNALDTLIVHRDQLINLPTIVGELALKSVELRADDQSFRRLVDQYPIQLLSRATDEDFGTEFLSLRLAITVVDSLDAALAHIATHGSKHSEAIVTADQAAANRFLQEVDAACVYHNASIAFTDGGEFGMGAELGISTQKLHARGPMALPELTTYKWLIRGTGQTRQS